MEMGVLATAGFAPFLIFGMFVGVWVDRIKRKPVLIVADFGRAAALLTIPLAAWLGILRMEQLYVVAFVVGTLTIMFNVAYTAYLPTLVPREHLTDGNARLEFSQSMARVTGPGLSGVLIQAIAAPMAVAVDSFSFLFSALSLLFIHEAEPPTHRATHSNMRSEMGEGIRIVFSNRYLRIITGCSAMNAFFVTAQGAIFVLFMVRELEVPPVMLGAIFSVGSIGGVLGALLAGKLGTRIGIGNTIALAHVLFALAILLLPATVGPVVIVALLLITSNTLFGFALVVKNVTLSSLRQSITPDRLQGRVAASSRFLGSCVIPFGPLFGGTFAERIGLRPTLLLCGLGSLIVAFCIARSPIRQLRMQPHSIEDMASHSA